MWRVNFQTFRGNPAFDQMYQRVGSKPGWVTKWAFIAAAIVIVVPLAVLALAGMLVGTIVFVLLALIAQVVAIVRTGFESIFGASAQSSGRRNVRVIHRD